MTAQHDIRLSLADVDGALVTKDKLLTEAAKAAVRELDQAGIAFAVTSGRPPRGMSMLIEPLALRNAIAGFNGGVLVNPDLSVIESRTLGPAAAKQALKLILDQGLDAWVYTEDQWLIRNKEAPHVARETWTVKFDARVVASFTDAHLAHTVKIVGISDDLDLVAACEKMVQTNLGEKASAARSQPYYLDVSRKYQGCVHRECSRIVLDQARQAAGFQQEVDDEATHPASCPGPSLSANSSRKSCERKDVARGLPMERHVKERDHGRQGASEHV